MFRRLIRHPVTQAAFARLLGLYLALVYRTTRWTILGEANLLAAGQAPDGSPRGLIVTFWHESLPMMPQLAVMARPKMPHLAAHAVHVLVSRHRDGRFIGDVVGRFGLAALHASSSAGGATGMRVMLRALASGDSVAITPDGPRGPRRVAAPGVAMVAAMSGLPVMPCAGRTTRLRLLPSWDRMAIPLPFARGVLTVGPLIAVPRADPLSALPAIEAALTRAIADAAEAVGRPDWAA